MEKDIELLDQDFDSVENDLDFTNHLDSTADFELDNLSFALDY